MIQNLGKIFIFYILFVNILYANISIDMIPNKKSIYFGDSLVVSVVVSKKSNLDLSSTKYIQPPFDGFISKEISKKSIRQGGYDITQIDYLLTPQKPGNYIIDPAKMTIVEKKTGIGSFFDRLFSRKPQAKIISSKMLSVTIKPLPSLVQLVGDFNISVKPNLSTTDIDTPVVLYLKIEGEGALGNFDGLDYSIDGLEVSAKEPKITQEIRDDKIYSSYIKEYVFESDHDFIIPSRNITIYNTKSNKIETMVMPSYDIKVIGSPSSSMYNDSSKDGSLSILWLIVSFIAGLVSMIFVLLAMSRKRKKSNKK
ncbi:MAG: BatD family protein [Sulfurovaceae bacterium]|nr:BatD family protein [Sulfurovaceae bacterium]